MNKTCFYSFFDVLLNMLRYNLLRYSENKSRAFPAKMSKKKDALLIGAFFVFLFVLVLIGRMIWVIPVQEMPTVIKHPPPPLKEKFLYPSVPDIEGNEGIKVENHIRRGDTIINVLKREGVDHLSAYAFFQDVKPVYNLKKISAGNKYTMFLSFPGMKARKFRYEINDNQYLEAFKDEGSDCFRAKIVTIPYKVSKEIIQGEITYSLFDSILDCNEKPELADILASLYEYDVDFNRDIRPGDSFAAIVEKKYLNGKFATYGHVLAAEFVNRGKVIRVIRYTDPEGRTAYYHPDGRSVRKMFLRCPLPFMRVTSRYGYRHRHPVLGFSARHHGVDFGAPVETKIRASASGVVQRVGYERYKGRYITIRHPNRYVSHYYHLSRRARNIKAGVKVEQGQVIGYVGNTGLTTGPHLHYGIQKNGRFINPLMLKSPAKNPVKKVFFEVFSRYAARHFLVISGSRLVSIPKSIQDALLGASTPQIQTTASMNP